MEVLLRIRALLTPILEKDSKLLVSNMQRWLLAAGLRKIGVRLSRNDVNELMSDIAEIVRQDMTVEDLISSSEFETLVRKYVPDAFEGPSDEYMLPADAQLTEYVLDTCPFCLTVSQVPAEGAVDCIFCGETIR